MLNCEVTPLYLERSMQPALIKFKALCFHYHNGDLKMGCVSFLRMNLPIKASCITKFRKSNKYTFLDKMAVGLEGLASHYKRLKKVL